MQTRRNSQPGYALISAMAIGIVTLSITGAVMLRMMASNSQVLQRDRVDIAQNISETVLNHLLDVIAEVTADQSDAGAGSGDAGIYITAQNFCRYLNSNDVFSTSNNTSSNSLSLVPLSQISPNPIPSGTLGYTNHIFDTSDGRDFNTDTANGTSTERGIMSAFLTSLDENNAHSSSLWPVFRNATPTSAALSTSPSVSLGSATFNNATLETMHKHAYNLYRVTKGLVTADVEISVVPLMTDKTAKDANLHSHFSGFANHNDVLKVRIVTYVPSIKNPKRIGKVETIINRPIIRLDIADFALSHAILAGGSVDLQNFNTSSGNCAAAAAGSACIDFTTSGDVHTNGNLSIGATGHVQGKATATGTVDVQGTVLPGTDYQYGSGSEDPRNSTAVSDRIDNEQASRSLVDPVPIPRVNASTTAADLVPCVNLTPENPDKVTYANCKLTGSVDVDNGKLIEFQGDVHITGNIDIRGSQRCTGATSCKVVIDGTAVVRGNGVTANQSTVESMYIVRGLNITSASDCLDIAGNPDTAGDFGSLYYIENPLCNTRVAGNSAFFGGIITKGPVSTYGNASDYGIQRDADMTSLKRHFEPEPAPKNMLFPQLITWKELR